MQIYFCDKCSCRVSEGDLAEKRAVRVGEYCFCRESWSKPDVMALVDRAMDDSGAITRARPPVAVGARPKSGHHRSVGQAKRRRTRTPHSGATRRKSPARGVARRPTPLKLRRAPSGALAANGRRTPVPSISEHYARSRAAPAGAAARGAGKRGMVTVLAVCVIVGMCLGFLLVYVLSSGRKPISSVKATEVSRSFSEGRRAKRAEQASRRT